MKFEFLASRLCSERHSTGALPEGRSIRALHRRWTEYGHQRAIGRLGGYRLKRGLNGAGWMGAGSTLPLRYRRSDHAA